MREKRDWTAPNAPRRRPAAAEGLAAKANDLTALREAVVDAASVSGGLWLSYLFVLLYLLIAAGSVTHRDLFFENPVKLPFLGVELPLQGFFVLGPLMFLIVHTYVLLHFTLLADKIGAFDSELQAQITDENLRTCLRRQLPTNIFAQILAGPHEVRAGSLGFLLRLISQISLVILPVVLLVYFQLQFLPFHDEAVTWWQRLSVLADLLLLWTLWPSIARGEIAKLTFRDFMRRTGVLPVVASLLTLSLVFAIATFPGERLDEHLPRFAFIPWWGSAQASASLPGASRHPIIKLYWVSPRDLLVGGSVNLVTGKPSSLWYDRLVLPRLDISDVSRFDSKEKIDAIRTTYSLRGRHLEGIVLQEAYLPKADFTGAHMDHALLDGSDLHESSFGCAAVNLNSAAMRANAEQDEDSQVACATLVGVVAHDAILSGAGFRGALLAGADFEDSDLNGTDFGNAKASGANFTGAQLIGADFSAASLQASDFSWSSLDGAQFDGAYLQGADFTLAALGGASLDFVCGWRTNFMLLRSRHLRGISFLKYDEPHCEPQKNQAILQQIAKRTYSSLDAIIHRIAPIVAGAGYGKSAIEKRWQSLLNENKNRTDVDGYKMLVAISCDRAGSPYVARAIVRSELSVSVFRRFPVLTENFFSRSDPLRRDFATALLDEDKCPGAKGLTDHDRSLLEAAADQN